jgi:TolB-like protein
MEKHRPSDGRCSSKLFLPSLSSLPDLKVTSLNTVLRYKGKQIDPQAVGRELRVRAVLIGRMTQRGDDMSISTELVDVANNSRLWARSYTRPRSDLLIMQEEIAKDIAERLRLRLGSTDRQRLAKNYTENTDAYVAYLTGRHLMNRRTVPSIEKSIEYFEQAVKLDPNYALAYAALANTHISLSWLNARLPAEVLPEATAAVAKALEIDETLAEAHAALGNIKLVDWDWSGAEREFRRAIELNPNYQRNHSDYDHYLRTMKRYDEAVAESKRILELEPVSVIYNRNLAMSFYMSRRYEEAIEQCLKTLELDPNMSTAYGWLAKSYERKGLYDQALEAYLKSGEFSVKGSDAAVALRNAYVGSGWKGVLRQMLELRQAQAKHGSVYPYAFAESYARLGEKDHAFAWLEKSYEQHSPFLTFLNDPVWDDLRKDPRYADMVRKMGLQP